MLISFLKKYKFQLILVVSILAILYPLSLFIYVPKWDNVNGYLPYRYFISDYVWNGHLPLWNSFQRLGYLGYADLQSGVWSPIVWVIMLFGKYTINSLIVELLSCYLFAGLGMFKLANYLFRCERTAFILGLSYALSGFMVGSSQLMVFLIAVTWFPWCIYALLQFFKTFKLRYQVLSALFMALFISGASPAYTIILAYIVVGIFTYQITLKRKKIDDLKKLVLGGVVMLVILVVLLLPYINAFLEFAPYFNRADRLEYSSFLLANPFTPVSYISFLLPHSVIAKSDWFNITDLSLRNGYFGLIALMGVASSLMSKMTRTKIVLLILTGTSLLLAAGGETFVFEYLYNLPGFGVFRHPSMFRAFTIFCLLLLAGNEIKIVVQEGISKRHKVSIFAILGLIVVAGIWALTKTNFSEVGKLFSDNLSFVEFSESALSTHLLLNVMVVFVIIGITFLARKAFGISMFYTLLIFGLLDFGIQSRLSIPTTVCYPILQDEVSNFFGELPNEINQKDNNTPLKQLDETQPLKKTQGIWQNLSTYNKTLSYKGVNPMRFKRFDEAEKDGRLDEAIQHNIMYAESDAGLEIKNIIVGYNSFSAEVTNKSKSSQPLILNQNYHHLWNASLVDTDLEISKYNDLTMKVSVPSNSAGKVTFNYESPRTMYLFLISLLGYVAIIVLLLRRRNLNA